MLNSSDYGDLNRASAVAQKRAPGKFLKVFVTGSRRPGQDLDKFQCMTNFDNNEYLIQNKDKVYFIPYFIKKYWEKKVADPRDNTKSNIVAMGWEDDVPKMDNDCKFVLLVAGVAYDPEAKKIMTHKKDLPDAEIKAGDPALIYFKCESTKYGSGMTLLNRIEDKAKGIPPLSDNIDFERRVVSSKRFLICTTTATVDTPHGAKLTYDFNPVTQLPDKVVLDQIMPAAKNMFSDFEKQFNRSGALKGGGSSAPQKSTAAAANPSFDNDDLDMGGSKTDSKSDDDFDLGL